VLVVVVLLELLLVERVVLEVAALVGHGQV
jgi:hypothetical protein